MEQVLRADVGLSKGVCTFRGCCTNKAAAKAFDIEMNDIQYCSTLRQIKQNRNDYELARSIQVESRDG